MIPIEDVRSMLERAFPGGHIELSSPMGDNHHFQAVIVSDRFREKSMVEQHQMVYAALGDAMREAIHALQLKTFTPEEWERVRGA